jgi:beta-ribofuranosylaminobenzene 5'-phosphate synthase
VTRVEAPARLHFGLLSVPTAAEAPAPTRQFGGVGLMIERPCVAVRAAPAEAWAATGRNAERALAFARAFMATFPSEKRRQFQIDVEACPEEHAGFGSGTALALAVARALACEMGYPELRAPELAGRVGRGERSAVGVHGFDRGGLIVEAGKKPDERVAPLVAHCAFPSEWHIVLVRAKIETRWHGSRERLAFSRIGRANPTDALCRIVITEMLPALSACDLQAFGNAAHEFNVRAGEAFADAQGGVYASPVVADLIGLMREMGIHGACQSSWGPTVFGFVANVEQALRFRDAILRRRDFPDIAVEVTRASPSGARTAASDATQ